VITRIVGRPNEDVTGSINIARFKKRNFVETYTETTAISINDNLSQFGMNSIHNEFLLRMCNE